MADINIKKDELISLLKLIQTTDEAKDYRSRNLFIYSALAAASWLGYSLGIRIDSKESEWPVAYIELPTGQVSWHLPQHYKEWDGHTTREKYKRIQEFVNG